MKNNFSIIIFCVSFMFTACVFEDKADFSHESPPELVNYVDPFIGTGGHGHTYPGATRPFGMIQLSPNNGRGGWDWSSGYHYSDSIIAGFSHLQLSGTGIGDLSDLLFMPVNKEVDLSIQSAAREDIPYISKFSHSNEKASPGFYQVFLDDHQVNVELTTTERTGYHKYTFEEGDQQSIVLDLGYAVNWDRPVATRISLENDNTISGFRHSTGWATNQKVFFVAEFSKAISSKKLYTEKKLKDGDAVEGTTTSAQFFFDSEGSNELGMKVALSSVSVENAKENLDSGIYHFEEIKNRSVQIWENALADIKVDTDVDTLKTIFYTSLYHTKLAPVTFSDKNGEFRKENDSIVKAEGYTAYSTLSLWDTFRAQQPLLTLTDPEKVSDIVNSMLEYYKVRKILPVWTLYGNETNTMTGYHSIPVIVEAYFKGIEGFDAEEAYHAVKNTMLQGERGLDFYNEFGYIPYSLLDESVTITLEYAYNDWCVAQMAKALGKKEDHQFFLNRSRAYEKLFDAQTGFMRGKAEDGVSWNTPFDPKHSNHRENTDYTEGNAWQHSWFVLHEPENLVKLHGGPEKFTERLEQLFLESSEITGENVSADISGLIGQYAHGNEPSHHIAYLFNKAGQPWRTQYWVREILNTQYSTQPDGLSGNEDAGQMSAWYVFSSMGLYPFNPASAEYEIGSPIFKRSVLTLADGKTFSIVAENVSDENRYIQSATLNSEDFQRTSITHKEIEDGGELKFIMGPTPNKSWAATGNGDK